MCLYIFIYLFCYIKISNSIQPFLIWNASSHIIISRTKVYNKDVQKIKFENLKSIMTFKCQRLFIKLAEFKKYFFNYIYIYIYILVFCLDVKSNFSLTLRTVQDSIVTLYYDLWIFV